MTAVEKLEELLKVYQPYDVDCLMSLMSICWDVGLDFSDINLGLLSEQQLKDACDSIRRTYTYEECEFIENELETRYREEQEQSCTLESLYGWSY